MMPVVEYRLITDPEDRDNVYRLRYDGYSAGGSIPKNDTRRSTDAFDLEPYTQIFGIYIAGRLASTLRLSYLSANTQHTPSMMTHGETLAPYLAKRQLLVDPTRLVIDPRSVAQFPELPYLTMRVPIMACLHFGADQCLSLVKRQHATFYKRLFRSHVIGPPVFYEGLNMDVQLMISSVPDIHDHLDTRYPFFRSTYLERRQLFGSASAMHALFEGQNQAA
ncbi:MAG: hypothetical protein AAFO73_10480 [Pseudomonadota bacterium]